MMKFLLVYALLALLAGTGPCVESDEKVKFAKITKIIKTGHIDIDIKDNRISLTIRKNDGMTTKASLYTKYPGSKTSDEEPLKIEQDCEKLTTCIQQANVTYAKIKTDPENEIVQVSRSVDNGEAELADCFGLEDEDVEWFGGPQWTRQHWPIQHMYHEEKPYLPSHPNNMALAERYWLSSTGVYVVVGQQEPLFLDQNNLKDRHLCLIARNGAPYQERPGVVTLSYEIGVFADPKAAHRQVVSRHFGNPTGHPNSRTVTLPIWSTWARFKADVNEARVREFADEIVNNGFKNSQIEIDDNWESCYGSASFDPTKFADPAKLMADLKAKDFRVSLWIHPFINAGCNTTDGEGYDYALNKGYFVKNEKGEVRTSWWQGEDAGVIDFTNPDAAEWWIGRLERLKQVTGIDSFKFDAGEESWLPGPRPQLTGTPELQPGAYSRNYTSLLANRFDDSIEVRVGWGTQSLPVFVRMIDKDSRWTWNNGLPTLVTTLLQMNLNGYVFVLPDMIGGNGYVDGYPGETARPSKELFIRWMQATVFMPAMQFSFAPWDYDNETIEIGKKFTQLHEEYAPKIIELMKKAVKTGDPINPPIWWVDPSKAKAHKINNEYMLGEEILVAPILEEGARSRDVYLPTGNWRDPRSGADYAGPIQFTDYAAPLNVLPYFVKI